MNKYTVFKLLHRSSKYAGAILFALPFAFSNAQVARYTVVELPSLMQGHPFTVHGPNLVGAAVGGGVVVGAGAVGRPRGFVFANGAAQNVPGLPNSDFTLAFGINDSGSIVGSSNTATAVRGFLMGPSGNTRELAPLPGDSGSTAFSINNNGEAVGFSSGPRGERAVLWGVNGAVTALPSEPGTLVRALAINSRSDVAGVVDNGGSAAAVVWRRAGPLQELPVLADAISSEPAGINATGDIVGFSQNLAGDRRATLWPVVGGAINLGTLPGGRFSQAYGINNQGEVVGTSGSSAGTRAFVWTSTAGMRDINTLIAPSTVVLHAAVGINNAGMIIATGQGDHADGHDDHQHEDHEAPLRVFLLKPSGL